MVAICVVRLKWLISIMISTLLFGRFVAWAICNARMMVMIYFLKTNVQTKQLGLATTFKEVVLLPVHHFAKYVIAPPYVLTCVQLTCIMLCTSRILTQKSIHLGTHDHLVVEGYFGKVIYSIK
jgi:hypothetical protein